MSKYSDEFKIKAVQMVLDANAVKYVCRMLAIPDSVPYVTGSPITTTAAFTSSFIKTVHILRILNKKSLSIFGSMGYH